MFTVTLIFNSAIFIYFLLMTHFVPGAALAFILKLPWLGVKRIIFSFTSGILIFILTGFIFGTLGIRYLDRIFILLLSLFSLMQYKKICLGFKTDKYIPHILLMGLGLVFALPVITSGWITTNGILLRGVNNQDGMWHLALIRELVQNFPPNHPGASGMLIRGYHIFYHLWASEILRIIPISPINLHFHFLPVFMSLLLIYTIYEIGTEIGKHSNYGIWAVIFGLFGGSFAYLLPFVGLKMSWDDAFGITQPASLMLSPANVLSLIFIFVGVLIVYEVINRNDIRLMLLGSILCGITIGIKVYGGILLLVMLLVMGFIEFRRYKRISILGMSLCSGAISFLVFSSNNTGYGHLIYAFMWPIHQLMMGNFPVWQWELKMHTMRALGSLKGQLKLYIGGLMFYLIGNFGSRIIGLWGIGVSSAFSNPIIISFGISSFAALILGLMFIQPIGTQNTIQFFWYMLVFVGIISGIGLTAILSKIGNTFLRVIFIFVVLIITLPSAYERISGAILKPSWPVTGLEYQLYLELEKFPGYGGVLELPNISSYSYKDLGIWFNRISLPRIAALSGKPQFFGNEIVQFNAEEIMKDRIPEILDFMNNRNPKILLKLYDKYNIRYIFTSIQNPWFEGLEWVEVLAYNNYGSIYKINYSSLSGLK